MPQWSFTPKRASLLLQPSFWPPSGAKEAHGTRKKLNLKWDHILAMDQKRRETMKQKSSKALQKTAKSLRAANATPLLWQLSFLLVHQLFSSIHLHHLWWPTSSLRLSVKTPQRDATGTPNILFHMVVSAKWLQIIEKSCCLTKHALNFGCLGFQVGIIVCHLMSSGTCVHLCFGHRLFTCRGWISVPTPWPRH